MIRKYWTMATLICILLGCFTSVDMQMNEAQKQLAKLGDDYWEWLLRTNPTWATYMGHSQYDDRLPDISEEERKQRHMEIEEFKTRLGKIDKGVLTEQECISCDILKLNLDFALEGEKFKDYQWNVDQMGGPQVWLLELLNYHPLKTEKNFNDLIARYEAFSHYIGQYITNLKDGLLDGRIAPRIAVTRVISQLKEILNTPIEKSPLMVKKFPQDFSEKQRAELSGRIEKAIGLVYKSYRDLWEFLQNKYLDKSRREVGVWAINDGKANYEYLVRVHTTADFTPDELHQIGLDELKSIQNEMMEIARKCRHKGTLMEFFAKLKTDKSQFPTSKEEIMERYNIILKKVETKLPDYFGKIPCAKCEVKAIEEYREKDSVAAFYYQPPEDFSRPGIFYANAYKPETRPLYNMTALAVHEAVPGHHLQIALDMELEDLPKFRRYGGFSAFVEGWALYTERLADEMGLYEGDLSRFGMLTYQAWRACRLIVDTGMHHLKWTRQQAIDFLRENTAMADEEIINEIDRYIIWPGQALAYKVGQREILSLRSLAQKELGKNFDIKEFHGQLLKNGSLPLLTLRKLVNEWIASKKR